MPAIMPAHLRHSESATRGLKRLLFLQLGASLSRLAGPPLDDDAIHVLRREIKRSRALLLLLRPALGKAAWRREDAALDAAARNFTTLRDRCVLQDTVDALVAGCGEPPIEAFAGEFRSGADVGVTELPERLARISRIQLTRSRTRLRRTRLTARNWSMLGPALRRSYRSARRAQAEASDTGSDEMLHRWRRWTKYLWHQLQLINAAEPQFKATGEQLHALADLLGRYHDLVVLRASVLAAACFAANPEGGARFIARLDAARATLRDAAHALGDPLFFEPPRAFEKRLRACWRGWRRDQASSASRR